MATPVFVPSSVIMNHGNYSTRPMTSDDWKMLAAFWISLHLFPLIIITISTIINFFKKDKYYDILDNNEFSWILLLALFAVDFLGLLTKFIYQII